MSYLAYGAVIAIVLLLVLIVYGKVEHKRLLSASEAARGRVYTPSESAPQLTLSYSYSYPAFTLTFRTKAELQAAADAGLNERFKYEIDALCKGRGPKSRPFAAEQAIFFTYEGWLEGRFK